MKKINLITVSIIFLLFINSCGYLKTIKVSIDEEIKIKTNNAQKFEILETDSKILVPIKIYDTEQIMYLDTRAPSIIFREKGTWTDTLSVVAKLERKLKAAGGNKIENSSIKLKSADCNLFTIDNWVVRILDIKLPCLGAIGIIGHDGFSIGSEETRKILKLDFDNQELIFIESVPADWICIKSKFRLGNIKIFLTIDGQEYAFGFDTGMGGELIFSQKHMNKSITSIPDKHIVYGNIFQVAGGGIIENTVAIKQVNEVFLTDKNLVNNVEMMIAPKSMENLVGVDFMRHYNWILDYKTKNVYIQPRKTTVTYERDSFFQDYLGASFDISTVPIVIRTMVVNSKAEQAGLKLNDEILSINKVDLSNIPNCEIKNEIKRIIKSSDKVVFKIKRNNEIKNIELL